MIKGRKSIADTINLECLIKFVLYRISQTWIVFDEQYPSA